MLKFILASITVVLLAAAQVWGAADNTCSTPACLSPFAFYHPEYPNFHSETDGLFKTTFGDGSQINFKLSSSAQVTAWDGATRTVEEHFDWMKHHIMEYAKADAPGFVKDGEIDGVVWEMHKELTTKHRNVGYFRLRAKVEVDPKTFASLMADPHQLFAMDDTVRIMDFDRSPKYKSNVQGIRKVWLAYFRQAPGFMLPDLDGVDVSGFEVQSDGTVVQASIGLPHIVPDFAGKWYPKAFRSWDMHWGYTLKPVDDGKHSELVLICQHDLRNWMIPTYLANKMVGQTLADYVRTAEKVGKRLVETGEASSLRELHGL